MGKLCFLKKWCRSGGPPPPPPPGLLTCGTPPPPPLVPYAHRYGLAHRPISENGSLPFELLLRRVSRPRGCDAARSAWRRSVRHSECSSTYRYVPVSVVVGAAVPVVVCRWGLCPRCPGVGRCLSGVYVSSLVLP